jgi:WD40 repeat protein
MAIPPHSGTPSCASPVCRVLRCAAAEFNFLVHFRHANRYNVDWNPRVTVRVACVLCDVRLGFYTSLVFMALECGDGGAITRSLTSALRGVLARVVVRSLNGHKANIRSLDFHPYGDFIASGSLDTVLKVSPC